MTLLRYTSKQSKNKPYKQNNEGLGAPYSLTALLYYKQHCATVNCNCSIIPFLWHKMACTIQPDPTAEGLVHKTTVYLPLKHALLHAFHSWEWDRL